MTAQPILKFVKVFCALIGALWLCVVVVHWPALFELKSRDSSIIRYRNALHIGDALNRYSDEHEGALPESLSALMPNYVAYSNLNWFVWPPPNLNPAKLPPSQAAVVGMIAEKGAFVYLGRRGLEQDLVFYECPELWPHDPLGAVVTTLTSNLLPRRRSVEEVTNRLAGLPRTE